MSTASPHAVARPLLDARDIEVALDGTAILKGATLQEKAEL